MRTGHDKKPLSPEPHPMERAGTEGLAKWGKHPPKYLLSFSLEVLLLFLFFKKEVFIYLAASGLSCSSWYLCFISWDFCCGTQVQLVGLAATPTCGILVP